LHDSPLKGTGFEPSVPLLRKGLSADAGAIANVYSASFRLLTFLPMLHTVEEDRRFIANVILKEFEVTIAEDETGIVASGYDPDVAKNRADARKIMQKLGYGPDKRLATTVSTRNLPPYRDPAVILIDQLKEIYTDGVLEPVDTTQWYPRITRRDFTVGLNVTESGVDDPGQQFYENYVCGSERNYTGYCNPEVDKLVDRQSMESDKEKRKQLVWEIERRLAEDNARPVIFYPRGATCRHPQVKGLTVMVNSIYNGYRYEDLWLDN
jgi:peptide/nickel transport system substrate-binding protein